MRQSGARVGRRVRRIDDREAVAAGEAVRVRSGARSLSVLLGCSLLAAACQLPAVRPPPAPAPPERELTICERPARQPAAAQDPEVEASFSAFARTWLEKMRQAGAAKIAPGGRRQIRAEFETELRQTGNTRVPWLGILRYCEDTLRCTGAGSASCQVSKTTAVTEIFPFQGGKWRY